MFFIQQLKNFIGPSRPVEVKTFMLTFGVGLAMTDFPASTCALGTDERSDLQRGHQRLRAGAPKLIYIVLLIGLQSPTE